MAVVSFVTSLLGVLLRAFVPAILEKMDDTAEESKSQPEIKARLRARIRERWGSAACAAAICSCAVLLGGCFTRTVYVPAGEPVRLRETLHDVKVWVPDASGKPVPGTLDLKEGWYALDLNPDKVTSAPVVKPKVEEDPMPSEPEAKKMLAEVR